MILKYILLLIILDITLKITHAESLSCYFCDSSLNPNCAIDPVSDLPIKECNGDENVCVVYIRQNETIRNCGISKKSEDLLYECTTSLCNNNVYPENRLKCYHCDGIDCIKEKSGNLQYCRKYYENDSCYTAVIDENDAIRGCNSEQELELSFKITCNGNECNNQPGIVINYCIECDGNTDKSCIRNQDGSDGEITTKSLCSVNKLLGRQEELCFTYHRFENVSRGCISYAGKVLLEPLQFLDKCSGENCNNVPIPIQKCFNCMGNVTHPECMGEIQSCSAEHTMCHTCLSPGRKNVISRGCGLVDTPYEQCNKCQNKDGCNNETFTSCLTCTSENHVGCIGLLAAYLPPAKGCEVANSSCITLINDRGYFERGCASNKLNCSSESKDCATCKGNNCNNETIAEKDVLRCYQCGLHVDCSDKYLSNTNLHPCNVWRKNNFCFEYIHESGNVVRGCNSEYTDFSKCMEKGEDCLTCTSKGCNNVLFTKITSQLGCATCNSKDNLDCRWPQSAYSPCRSHPFINETEYCYTYTNELGFTKRGCSLDDRMCLTDGIDDCKVCDTTSCNINVATRQVCLNGTITDGANNNHLSKIECTEEETSCYVKRNGSEVIRGCYLDLTESEAFDCRKSKECKICSGDSCEHMEPPLPNQESLLQCYSCHSVNDSNCATNPINTLSVSCGINQKFCYTAIIGTATVRGCMSPDIVFTDHHKKCIGHYCNNKVFPEDRLKCHQCKGNDDCSIKQNLYLTSPCKIYKNVTDECFEYLLDPMHVVRGCSSDIDQYEVCQKKFLDCKECNTNGCNNKYSPLKKPILSCIKCNSTVDKNCQWTQNSTLSESCIKTHSSALKETCYALVRKDGFIQRGCLLDDEIGKTWYECNKNGCNNVLLLPQVCFQGTIKNNQSNTPIKLDCKNRVQPYQTQGCYVEKTNEAIIWGCAVDLDPSKLENCKNATYEYCNFCMGADCEKMKSPFSDDEHNNAAFSYISINFYSLLVTLSVLQVLISF